MTPIHALLVHAPIAFAIFTPLVCLFGLGAKRWGWVILWLFCFVASTYAAMATGNTDADLVRPISGNGPLDAHETAATTLFSVLLALFALAFLSYGQDQLRYLGKIASIVLSCVILGLTVYTARLGGKLVYEHNAPEAHKRR
ncbi:MAG: hypothetical protein K8S54_19775 [Spirochaetia bacterium]|nr:hypothetical protein [Spirochaetia bacterium]